jgi:hypothetical protein
LYNAASSGDSQVWSTFAWLVSPSVVKLADPMITEAGSPSGELTRNLSWLMEAFVRGEKVKPASSAKDLTVAAFALSFAVLL